MERIFRQRVFKKRQYEEKRYETPEEAVTAEALKFLEWQSPYRPSPLSQTSRILNLPEKK